MHTESIEKDKSPSRAWLIKKNSDGPISAVELGEFNTLGRDPGNSIPIESPYVSSRHARIEKKQNRWILRDFQSRNGCFVNDVEVKEAILMPQDRIRLAQSEYLFAQKDDSGFKLKSKNKEWQEQLDLMPAFAQTDFPVLMTGPSGSGKDVLANWIHQNSRRSHHPILSINCSALSESLIESELFGHIKGSFTGAAQDRKGAFESASGGTLFLDEIGDLPLSLQPKLLRALENQEIKPVGSDQTKKINVRLIAGTHQNLESFVSQGKFRNDLFFRLNVCRVRLPKLIDRMEDFDTLAYQFAKDLRVRLSFEALSLLKNQPWPGNIRELKNCISRASAYFPGEEIRKRHLDRILDDLGSLHFDKRVNLPSNESGNLISRIEKDLIVEKLIHHEGNQRRVSEEIGIPRSTLNDKIKRYRINIRDLVGNKPRIRRASFS